MAADTYYTYRFLRLMTTKWEDLPAFELGILDKNGKLLIKPRDMNNQQNSEYTLFHRLVFNLKRAVEKLPIKRSFSSYAAALFLLRENYEVDINHIKDLIDDDLSSPVLKRWFINEEFSAAPGTYSLNSDAISPITGNVCSLRGTSVTLECTEPVGEVFGKNLYKVRSNLNIQCYYVTSDQIER